MEIPTSWAVSTPGSLMSTPRCKRHGGKNTETTLRWHCSISIWVQSMGSCGPRSSSRALSGQVDVTQHLPRPKILDSFVFRVGIYKCGKLRLDTMLHENKCLDSMPNERYRRILLTKTKLNHLIMGNYHRLKQKKTNKHKFHWRKVNFKMASQIYSAFYGQNFPPSPFTCFLLT